MFTLKGRELYEEGGGGGSYIFCPGPSAGAAAAEELVTVLSSSVFHPFSVQGISHRGFAVQMSRHVALSGRRQAGLFVLGPPPVAANSIWRLRHSYRRAHTRH